MPDNIVARRRFALGDDSSHYVEALVFEPVEDNDDYRCQYEIREDGKLVWQSHAMGVDSLQALILALRKLGADITFSDHAKKGRLYWNNQNQDLGLLLPK